MRKNSKEGIFDKLKEYCVNQPIVTNVFPILFKKCVNCSVCFKMEIGWQHSVFGNESWKTKYLCHSCSDTLKKAVEVFKKCLGDEYGKVTKSKLDCI